MVETYILRIGHRHDRDQRVTTHVGLTGRALGAKGMFLAADDPGVVESIAGVAKRFGGSFTIRDKVSWKQCINEFKASGGRVVHLTMYGLRIQDLIGDIRTSEKILIVVGAEKVPGEVYGLADYNVAVTNQPHSEIAGLAVFLDQLYQGRELDAEFSDAEISVIPCERGKETVER